MVGPWKLLKGTTYQGQWDNWYGPDGRDYFYNSTSVIQSVSGLALKSINMSITNEEIGKLRKEAEITCQSKEKVPCNPLKELCLYNILQDPCETRNVAKE